MTNGVFERLVENWLTRANEREYQFPFCQALVSKGYRVMHLSTHGPQEQGKDIIAIDPKGRAVGYQLKTGDLTTTAYRAIAGEVGELVELPIKYPGVRADGKHRCVLVTNGTLTDPVREQIVDRNVSWRRKKYPELEVMPKDVLLREFLDASAPVFPVQLNSVHALLALYAHPGNGPLPCDKWSEFLIENVPLGELSRPGERLRRKEVRSRAHATTPSAAGLSGKRLGRHLSSAALLAGYALHPRAGITGRYSRPG